jgi:hypothetical protein
MVGAGAVVTNNVPPHAIIVGNPARIVGYTKTGTPMGLRSDDKSNVSPTVPSPPLEPEGLGVGKASLIRIKHVTDLRGDLSVGEFASDLPFQPQRYFLVYNVPTREVRGEHAHRACHQFLICVKGSCSLLLDDGQNRNELKLDQPDIGVYMPPMIWGSQFNYSPDAVLLVFASHTYDSTDYIRTYDSFLSEISLRNNDA